MKNHEKNVPQLQGKHTRTRKSSWPQELAKIIAISLFSVISTVTIPLWFEHGMPLGADQLSGQAQAASSSPSDVGDTLADNILERGLISTSIFYFKPPIGASLNIIRFLVLLSAVLLLVSAWNRSSSDAWNLIPLLSFALFLIVNRHGPLNIQTLLELVITLLVLLALAFWLLFVGRIISHALGFSMLAETGAELLNNYWERSIFITLVPLLSIAITLMLLRFSLIAISQNIAVFRTVGVRSTLKLSLKSLLLWLPILIFAIPAEWLTRECELQATGALYEFNVAATPGRTKTFFDDPKYEIIRPGSSRFDPTDDRIFQRIFDPTAIRHSPLLVALYVAQQDDVLSRIDSLLKRNAEQTKKAHAYQKRLARYLENQRKGVVQPRIHSPPPSRNLLSAKRKLETAKAKYNQLFNGDSTHTTGYGEAMREHSESSNVKRNVEQDVWRSIDDFYDYTKFEALWAVDEVEKHTLVKSRNRTGNALINARVATENWRQQTPIAVVAAFDDAMPRVDEIGMDNQPITWKPNTWGRLAGNQIRKHIRRAYEHTRVTTRSRILDSVKTQANATASRLIEKIDLAKRRGDTSFRLAAGATDEIAIVFYQGVKQARIQTHASLTAVSITIWIVHTACCLAFMYICLRSFAYVFSRVAFGKDSGVFVSLGHDLGRTASGSVKAHGTEYVINSASECTYYVSRQYQPQGCAPNFAIPQPGASFLRRIVNRAWTMNRISPEKATSSVRLSAIKGVEFVEWNLLHGETIIFRYANFVGFTSTCTLSTVFSGRLSTLLLGRMFFSAATGPGKVILRTKGRPLVGDSPATNVSVAADQLVAWQQSASFSVDSELNPTDLFLSGAYLKKQPSDKVVLDADEIGKPRRGLFKFVRYFLLPT